MKITICGSFNKFLYEMEETVSDLRYYKEIELLSPKGFDIIKDENQFIRLKTDIGNSIYEIEYNHLKSINSSDYVLVFNPKNYIGISTAFEIGYAIQKKKRLAFSHYFPSFLTNSQDLFEEKKTFYHDMENWLNICLKKKYDFKIEYKPKNYLFINNENQKINPKIAFQIGISVAKNIPIFSQKEPINYLLKQFINPIKLEMNKKLDYNFTGKFSNLQLYPILL